MLNFHVNYEVLNPLYKCTFRLHSSGDTTGDNIEKEKRQGNKRKRRKVCAFFLDINEAKETS